MDVAAAAGDLADSRDDLDVGRLLEHVAARAGGERLADVARVVLHREDEDLRLGPLSCSSVGITSRPSAVRHHDVHQDHVGLQRPRLEDRLTAGAGLADRLDVVLAREQQADAGADDRVVVDDQHPDRLSSCIS